MKQLRLAALNKELEKLNKAKDPAVAAARPARIEELNVLIPPAVTAAETANEALSALEDEQQNAFDAFEAEQEKALEPIRTAARTADSVLIDLQSELKKLEDEQYDADIEAVETQIREAGGDPDKVVVNAPAGTFSMPGSIDA